MNLQKLKQHHQELKITRQERVGDPRRFRSGIGQSFSDGKGAGKKIFRKKPRAKNNQLLLEKIRNLAYEWLSQKRFHETLMRELGLAAFLIGVYSSISVIQYLGESRKKHLRCLLGAEIQALLTQILCRTVDPHRLLPTYNNPKINSQWSMAITGAFGAAQTALAFQRCRARVFLPTPEEDTQHGIDLLVTPSRFPMCVQVKTSLGKYGLNIDHDQLAPEDTKTPSMESLGPPFYLWKKYKGDWTTLNIELGVKTFTHGDRKKHDNWQGDLLHQTRNLLWQLRQAA